MAAPSQRFTGAHQPSGLSLQSYGMPSAHLNDALLPSLQPSACLAALAARECLPDAVNRELLSCISHAGSAVLYDSMSGSDRLL